MASPDARPDVTAQHMRDGVVAACTIGELLDDADRFAIRSDSASWYVGQLASVVRQLQRRLTEQEAEIARLRERLTTLENERAQRVSALANGVPKKALAFIAENPKTARDHELSTLLDLLTAAEQALTAARRERDEARVREVVPAGPPRWVCKSCGKPRRRHECLSCGSTAPLTDERHHPGIIR